MSNGIVEELRKHKADLLALKARQTLWNRFETWAEAFRRFVRRNFAEEVADFERIMEPPKWISVPAWGDSRGEAPASILAGQRAEGANDGLVEEAKNRLLAFVDDLLTLAGNRPNPVPISTSTTPDPVPQFPFRPYKRFQSRTYSATEYHAAIQTAALTGQAEWQEVERVGGTPAVLASIRRHVSDFDPAEATEPFGPAWLKLMPVLQRCGVQPVDETTTLTVIKAYLDAAEVFEESPRKPKGATLADPQSGRSPSNMAQLQIFVSWSQACSRHAAEAFREWLPNALPGVAPWMSSEDITKGRPWFRAISEQLIRSGVCLICVTPENVKSPWLFYEAGGVAHAMPDALICTYLIGVEPSALTGTPLAHFQATRFDKEDTRRLMRDFNRRLKNPHDELLLRSAFDKNWTSLQKKLSRVLTAMNTADELDDPPDAELPSPGIAPTSGAGAQQKSISEIEYEVLVQVVNHQSRQQRATARAVASALNMTEEKATFYLDELSRKHELLNWVGNMDPTIVDHYTLTHEGRRLLVERGVI